MLLDPFSFTPSMFKPQYSNQTASFPVQPSS